MSGPDMPGNEFISEVAAAASAFGAVVVCSLGGAVVAVAAVMEDEDKDKEAEVKEREATRVPAVEAEEAEAVVKEEEVDRSEQAERAGEGGELPLVLSW